MRAENQEPGRRKVRMSISGKTLFSILLLALALGMTAIVIGYRVYCSSMDSHYLNNTIRLAHTISALVDQGTVAKYGEAIYKQYLDASDEERENQEGEEYRSRFEGIENNADYQAVRSTLTKIKEENDATI